MKKNYLTGLTLVMTGVLLFGCTATDVVLKYAPDSLRAIEQNFADLIVATEGNETFVLSVDKETSLLVSSDFSKMNGMDIVIETPIAPFLAAGLDTTKLSDGYLVKEDMLLLTSDYGSGIRTNNLTDALLSAAKADRAALSYHLELDHYGIGLTRGKIEWAKDYKTNDKDIVFVIQAKPLAEIGVNVQQVEGWIFATMKEEDGSPIELLLKPYNLQ